MNGTTYATDHMAHAMGGFTNPGSGFIKDKDV